VRILHLETGRHLYGGARQAGYLIRELAARGHDNVLVCATGSAIAGLRERSLADRRLTDGQPGIEVIEWPLHGDLDWRLPHRLARLIEAKQPDLVHVHSRRGADTFGGRAARAAGVPSILTRRVESAEPRVWLRLKVSPYDAVVAISGAVREELAVRAGIERERIRLIPSAVDTELFRPDPAARARVLERFGLPAGSYLSASAAQLISRKGQDFLLRLAARLASQRPDFRLLLFGRGPDRARLERQARQLGLGEVVRFCGFAEDWPELLPGLDLLLHPARREGLGAVALEAMAAGVPVVASAVGGLVDVIETGVDGMLVPPDDERAWIAAIGELSDADNDTARTRLAAAARRKIESTYTIAQMTDRYLKLYRDVQS